MAKKTYANQKANVKKWVAALRSGDYKQCQQQLAEVDDRGKHSYCCLGVACEVLGVPYNPGSGDLPSKAVKLLGLRTSDGTFTKKEW